MPAKRGGNAFGKVSFPEGLHLLASPAVAFGQEVDFRGSGAKTFRWWNL